MKKEKFRHSYSGECAPGSNYKGPVPTTNFSTFSVGIFQWIPKASGKGLKKSPVKFRIKGYTSDPQKVYDLATKLCRAFDGGWKPDTKSETVK